MIFGKKPQKNSIGKREKLLRKPPVKDTGRKGSGFQCSPKIWAMMKDLSTQLNVLLGGLVEHALQLGAEQIADALKDPAERERLRDHIIEVHRKQRPTGDMARYDEDATAWLDEKRNRQFALDRLVRNLQGKYAARGIQPGDLAGLIEDGIRYRVAMAKGQFRSNG